MLNKYVLLIFLIAATPLGLVAQVEVVQLVWGSTGIDGVNGNAVPPGKVWLIKAAGLFTDDGNSLPWMLEIKKAVPGGFWLIPVERPDGNAGATPTLALTRQIILTEGELLQGRSCGIGSDKHIGLSYVGWEFPASDLPKLLGVQ